MMSAYIVEGSINDNAVKWSRRGKTYFSQLAFDKTDGTSAPQGKVVATDAVAAELAIGTKGRFYLFKSMGVTSIYGARFAGGREVREYPGDQSMIFAIVALFWLVYNIFLISTDKISLLGVVLTPLGIFGWIWCRKVRGEIERLWQDDAGPDRPPSERKVATIS
jgi:hypothetical protein